jgi:hypothetical protein
VTNPITFPPPPPAPPPPTDHRSWTIAAVALLVVRLASTILQARVRAGGFSSGYVVGAVVADLAIVGIAYGIASVIVKPPRRRRRAAITAFVVVAVMLVADCSGGLSRTAATVGPLSDAERTGLQMTPAGITHPLLGFSAPHPGEGFAEDTAMARVADSAMAPQKAVMQVWSFSRTEPLGVAILQVMTGALDERGFRQFADGMRSRLADPSLTVVLLDSLTWTDDRRELRFKARHPESGGFIGLRCLPTPVGHPRAYIVCAMGTALDSAGVNAFTEGLAVTDAPR